MTKALVTGATGFIGRNLAERLLDMGWELTCPTRDQYKPDILRSDRINIIGLDEVQDHLETGPGCDYIFHLAGATRGRNYEDYERANVLLTAGLLESASKGISAETMKRFLFVSSQAAAGPASELNKPVREQDTPRPVSLYGKSKLEAEKLCKEASHRIPITIVRPPAVFGPGDKDVFTVFQMAGRGIQTIPRGPDRPVSVVYVKDLVKGIIQAATSEASKGETFFLANPEPVVWREFCLSVSRVYGRKCLVLPVPIFVLNMVARFGDISMALTGKPPLIRSEKLIEMLQPAWICSSEKARVELGWIPGHSIDQALIETLQWYRDQGWL
jgi:nucleoside-diphosphate-sugar epimerase